MINPLEKCISALVVSFKVYTDANRNRKEQSERCCLFSFHLAGINARLASDKLELAEKIIYTLEQIQNHYQDSLNRTQNYQPVDRDQLAYQEFVLGFARIKNCIETGSEIERRMNTGLTSPGLLAETFRSAKKMFDTSWIEAKDNIWATESLRGILFEYQESNKKNVFESFDTDLKNKQKRFAAIIEKPEVIDLQAAYVQEIPAPTYQRAYAPH